MSTTNYWNKLSGDSLASPWNQDNWAAGAPSQVPGTNPWLGESSKPGVSGSDTPWMPQVIDDVDPNSPWYNPNNRYTGSFLDHMKPDERYGSQGISDSGVGYWSGGRPGAGSWIESGAPNGATGQENLADGSMMTHQMYSRTPAVSDESVAANNNYMINNVQMSPTEPLSNWYLKELAQTQPSSTTSRVKQKLF